MANYALDANCIGAWLLDEASGTIYDASANNIDSTSESGTFSYGATGKFGKALDFTDGEVDFGDVTIFDSIDKFSMSCYLYIDALPGNNLLYSVMRKDGTLTPLQLSNVSGNYFVRMPLWTSAGALVQCALDYTLPTGEWICLQATWDKDVNSGKPEFFLNGSSIGSASTGSTTTVYASGTNGLHFGRTESATEPYNGKLDEVIYFNDILSTAELSDIRVNGITGAATTRRRISMFA